MTLPDELKAKERALFREIEEGKKNVADLLSRLNNAESIFDSYVLEVKKFRGNCEQ